MELLEMLRGPLHSVTETIVTSGRMRSSL